MGALAATTSLLLFLNLTAAARQHHHYATNNSLDTSLAEEQASNYNRCCGSGSKLDPFSAALWIRICSLNPDLHILNWENILRMILFS